MKISPKSAEYMKQHHEKKESSASMFLSFLIKYCMLPVTVTDDKIEFKLLSWKTMVHAGAVSGINFLYALLTMIITPLDFMEFLGDNAVGKHQKY